MTDKTSKYWNSNGIMSNFGRPIGWLQLIANFAGAGIVTSYFVFFDQVFRAQLVQNTFYVVGIMFVGLVFMILALGMIMGVRHVEAQPELNISEKWLDIAFSRLVIERNHVYNCSSG